MYYKIDREAFKSFADSYGWDELSDVLNISRQYLSQMIREDGSLSLSIKHIKKVTQKTYIEIDDLMYKPQKELTYPLEREFISFVANSYCEEEKTCYKTEIPPSDYCLVCKGNEVLKAVEEERDCSLAEIFYNNK